MASPPALKGSRRDLAIALRGERRTANELAKALGKPTGSIFGVLRRMHAEGLLEADSDPHPPTRGTLYTLAGAGEEALRAIEPLEGRIGELTEGAPLLLVLQGRSMTAAAEVLTTNTAAGLIDWGAELHGGGWLIALVDGAAGHRVRALHMAFERAGCECIGISIGDLATGALLRRRATDQLGRSADHG